MTGIGGMSYVVATGDAPAAMNGVVVVGVAAADADVAVLVLVLELELAVDCWL